MCANGLDLQDRSLGTCVLRGSQQEFHVKYRLPNSGWRNEVKAMQRLKHPHIIALEEVFEKPEQITLVMERTHGGDLYSLLARTSNYSERAAAEMLYNLLQAVEYMHHQRIIHCDLKLENVLLVSPPVPIAVPSLFKGPGNRLWWSADPSTAVSCSAPPAMRVCLRRVL